MSKKRESKEKEKKKKRISGTKKNLNRTRQMLIENALQQSEGKTCLFSSHFSYLFFFLLLSFAKDNSSIYLLSSERLYLYAKFEKFRFYKSDKKKKKSYCKYLTIFGFHLFYLSFYMNKKKT